MLTKIILFVAKFFSAEKLLVLIENFLFVFGMNWRTQIRIIIIMYFVSFCNINFKDYREQTTTDVYTKFTAALIV